MIITLLGYMGSGKTKVSKLLGCKLNCKIIDLDQEISTTEGFSIPDLFTTKGEVYFRKKEREILEKLLSHNGNFVLSLGGGTPVYYDNIHLVNEKSKSIYLRTRAETLAYRLKDEKNQRPLIAKLKDDDLPEFIAKHLFERSSYYQKAHITIDTDNKSCEKIAEEILLKIK